MGILGFLKNKRCLKLFNSFTYGKKLDTGAFKILKILEEFRPPLNLSKLPHFTDFVYIFV